MRLHSTRESPLTGKPTFLALAETLIAMAASLYVVIAYNTLVYVAVGACLAPFLLLRTDESTQLAIRWFEGGLSWLDRPGLSIFRPEQFGLGLFLIIAPPIIRVASVITVVLRHPLDSFKAIPTNCVRQVLCIDLMYPPEVIPGIENSETESAGFLKASEHVSLISAYWRDDRRPFQALAGGLFFLAVHWLPAVAYRYSFKATALVYLPLLWVAHESLTDEQTLADRLEDVVFSAIERLKRVYSAFVIIVFVVLPVTLYVTFHEWWSGILRSASTSHSEIVALLAAFIFTSPTGLDVAGWHVARAVNACLTFGLYFYAESRVREIRRGGFERSTAAATRLSLAFLLRGV